MTRTALIKISAANDGTDEVSNLVVIDSGTEIFIAYDDDSGNETSYGTWKYETAHERERAVEKATAALLNFVAGDLLSVAFPTEKDDPCGRKKTHRMVRSTSRVIGDLAHLQTPREFHE